jgi:ketosteroid isomerase-like protein
MPCSLPEPLSEYFAAANARDPDRVAACFAESAILRDEGREIRGRSNIRAWAEHTGRIYRYTATVMAAEQTADRAVVTAHLTGDFPGNPIDLHYRFTLAQGRIARLEIGP